MSFNKKTCVHCFSDMPSPAFICPHCRFSQFISYQDIVRNQRSQNNNFNQTQYPSTIGGTIFGFIIGIICAMAIFWIMNSLFGPFF